mmetsp:Transcript_6052/g.14561  ORF Transcript_6052/g.14561 Transcript_6052/m.14561 type:complete len:445 (-) Transcript_6052:139-1473(-)
MKVKVLNRVEEDFTRERKGDVAKVFRNPDPTVHPFERAREYTRALNATKLDKVFAKPFVRALSGHRDGVCCMNRSRTKLTDVASGSCDGELKLWDLARGEARWSVHAHSGFVRGVAFAPDGGSVWTCGDDKIIKMWDRSPARGDQVAPLHTIMGQFPFMSLDHHWSEPLVATCGVDVQVWDHERSEAVVTLSWGSESVQSVRFNPVERHVLASTASDRSVVLHDIRSGTAIRKLVMNKRNNAMCWNPMEAFNFVLANEDHNLYTFDMRRMDFAKCVHKDHVSAVMDVDFSPTGREFVSGSYDRTVRIFRYNEGRSREVYHGKRMQRIFSVAFSGDAKFVLSGSDDFNIRLWKASASEGIKPTMPREARAQEYQSKLKDRFKEAPEVKRIARHRHLPKAVLKASKLKGIIKESKKRKEDNVRKHSKKGAVPHVAERKKGVVKELA